MTPMIRRAVTAGAAYFASVFAVGFVLGALRTLVVAPRLGDLAAVALELPLMLAASWTLAGALVARFSVPPDVAARLAMGGIAFILLMAAEALLSRLAGRTLAEHLVLYARPEHLLGLAGQIAFGLIPLARSVRR